MEEEHESLTVTHLTIPPKDDDEHEAFTGILLDEVQKLTATLGGSDYSSVEEQVSQFFQLPPETTDRSDVQFKLACREWTRATLALREHWLLLLDGGSTFGEADWSTPLSRQSAAPNISQKASTGPKISTVVDDFLIDRAAGITIRENTKESYRQHVRAFIDVLGDMEVDAVTYIDATRLRDTLLRLPKNRKRVPAYSGKTVTELLALNIPKEKRPSGRTVKETLGGLSTLFRWLERRDFTTRNPFDGVQVATNSQSHTEFTAEDLEMIFRSPLYIPGSEYCRRNTTTAGQWWLPLMALYTGARPSELVQMRLEDVSKVEGVLVARVVESEDTGQQIKTAAARRIVPVHPDLLRLGFADYVENMRTAGAVRLLKGIALGRRKAGDQAGKWFNERYRGKYFPQFKSEGKKLYSFRHTTITHALNAANIRLEYVQQIVGHERSQMGATKHYDKGAGALRLFEELSKINFGCSALDALRDDWRQLTLVR